jgi:sulfonate transport system substrate-binding protein
MIRLLLSIALLLLPVVARAEEPVKLRIAYTSVPVHLMPLLFIKPEILRHYGRSFTVEAISFRGSAPEITALATGDLDLATLGFSSVALAIQNAHMTDLRVVADGHRDGVGAYFSNQYVVRKNGGIDRVEDLRGKVLATNGIGGAADMGMRKMLRDHGMEAKRDYQIIEVEFPNMIPAVAAEKVALATLVQPFAFIAEKEGDMRVLFTLADAMGENQTTILVSRAPFIAAHRAVLVDFFEDAQRAIRWYIDPKNRDEAIRIIANFTKQPPAAYADWLFTERDNYRDPDMKPNLAALQNNLDVAQRLGFLKQAVAVGDYADLSMIDEATGRNADASH